MFVSSFFSLNGVFVFFWGRLIFGLKFLLFSLLSVFSAHRSFKIVKHLSVIVSNLSWIFPEFSTWQTCLLQRVTCLFKTLGRRNVYHVENLAGIKKYFLTNKYIIHNIFYVKNSHIYMHGKSMSMHNIYKQNSRGINNPSRFIM